MFGQPEGVGQKLIRIVGCWSLVLGTLLIASVSAQQWKRYGPGTRSQASAIFDASTNQMIVFGGQHAPTAVDFHDTWSLRNAIPASSASFSNALWVNMQTKGTVPVTRFGHSAVYNSATNRMILFGGGTGFPGPCANDLWVLKNPNGVGGSPTWLMLTPTGSLPPVREGHTAVYDPSTNTMVVFGGTNCNGNYYSDVWILSNADGSAGTPAWTQAQPVGTGPTPRSQSAAIYDSINNVMTLFGGGAGGNGVFNDVFTLSNANGIGGTPTWTELFPTGVGPSARSGHTAVYDSANNLMVIDGGGGATNGSVFNDTWILGDANGLNGIPSWTQLNPASTGPYRKSHTAIYDPVSNDMIIFGGTSQLPINFTDDHVFILTHANGLP